MATFLVILTQSGPEFDRSKPLEEQSGWPGHADFMDGLVEQGLIVLGGPLGGGPRVAQVFEAGSEQEIRDALARDPWSGTHLEVFSVEPWVIRLRSPS
jgi:hypothetical protein